MAEELQIKPFAIRKRKALEVIEEAKEDLELANLELEAKILQNKAKKLRTEGAVDLRKCVICMEFKKLDYILSPCGHRCHCNTCIQKINECSVCRKHINGILKIYE